MTDFLNLINIHLTNGEIIFFISIISALLLEELFRLIKSTMKKRIYSKYAETKNPEATEFYIEYYRKSQVIDVERSNRIGGILREIVTFVEQHKKVAHMPEIR